MPETLDRRQFARYRIQLPLLHKAGYPAPARVGVGWTGNLGVGGACVELAERLQALTPLRLRLQTDQGAIDVEAQVVWPLTHRRRGEASFTAWPSSRSALTSSRLSTI